MKPTTARLVRALRRTPLHPQWLLGGDAGLPAAWLARAQGRVLDVGCADRRLATRLPAGCEYLGLDHPVVGGGRYGSRPDVFADAAVLPFPDASFDTVAMFEVWEHLPAPRAALREIRRVLRGGGRALLSVPFLYPVHDAPHDFQRPTVHGLERDLRDAGLAVEAIEPTLDAIRSGALLLNLALAGTALQAWQRRHPALLAIPLLGLVVPALNLSAWALSHVAPPWPALTAGYRIVARAP